MKKSKCFVVMLLTGLLSNFLVACGDDASENQPAIYDASGGWSFVFTQNKVVDGDYIECGQDPEPQRFYTITQNANDVSMLDKNAEFVKGSVSAASYNFSFREIESDFNDDYIDFDLRVVLSSESDFSGTYRMDERTFFTEFNTSFYCITEGALQGVKR